MLTQIVIQEFFNADFIIPEEIKGIEKTCPKAGNNGKVDLKGNVCKGGNDGSSPIFQQP